MSERFVLSDPHIGHEKCNIKWRKFLTQEEYHQLFVENWNKTVGKRDVVHVLGDILFGGVDISFYKQLNGIKHLVLGNHDNKRPEWYAKAFNQIKATDCLYRRWLLSHIPVHPSSLDYKDMVNVHGHIHSGDTLGIARRYPEPSHLYINVNVEFINYTPISLDELEIMRDSVK